VEGTTKDASEALVEFRRAMEDLRSVMAPNGSFRLGLASALEQLAETARSLGELAHYLERNPNALISGRRAPSK
jgi:paraquat-inducible protein B